MTRRALVTGASSGIGQEVIRSLLADGWEVICTSRSQPPIPAQDRYHWHCMDLSDRRYTYALANMIHHRPIDLLVHCSLPCLLPVVTEEIGAFVTGGAIFSGPAFLATRGQEAACPA